MLETDNTNKQQQTKYQTTNNKIVKETQARNVQTTQTEQHQTHKQTHTHTHTHRHSKYGYEQTSKSLRQRTFK